VPVPTSTPLSTLGSRPDSAAGSDWGARPIPASPATHTHEGHMMAPRFRLMVVIMTSMLMAGAARAHRRAHPAPSGGEPQWGGLPHAQIEDMEVREIPDGYELRGVPLSPAGGR